MVQSTHAMKIIKIEPIVVKVNHRGNWVFVRIHTDAGITGLGEASHSGDDGLLQHVLKRANGELAGRDPFQIEAARNRLEKKRTGWVERTALSAVEQALWDIVGQSLKVPVHVLLGGAIRDRVRLYANINRHIENRNPEGFAEAAQMAVDEGFTAIKIAPFDELNNTDRIRSGSNAAWRSGVERIQAVRNAIGKEVEIAIDCHGRMEASEAISAAKAMEELNILWLEEPVPDRYPEELLKVSNRVSMATASGENLFGVEGFRDFLTQRAVDIIMPDVKHDGGIMETKLIAGAARLNQVLVAPHNPAGPVATAASAQVVSTLTNFLILEYAWGEVEWRANLLDPPENIVGGFLVLSDRPGLGHQLNDTVLNDVRIQHN